jgi:four helix bundle protein
MSKLAQTFRDLEVYQEALRLQQEIFTMTKRLPAEERFSLTDQIRRSSRSIGANIAEAWAKRRYPAHFLQPVK